jgi:hypothetical protein
VAGKRPDAEIMALIERIARFMETLDSHFLNDAFADGKVVLPTFSRVVMQLRAGRRVSRSTLKISRSSDILSATRTISNGRASLRSFPCLLPGEGQLAEAHSSKPAAGPSYS